MHYLINTMNGHQDTIGTVIGVHRTEAAAERRMALVARTIKRDSGPSSYLPMQIVESDRVYRRGQMMDR